MQLLEPVRNYLSRRHIGVPDDWLGACIEWVLSEYPQRNVSFIQDKVYQEWLHANLCELATSCLPLQVQERAPTTISGHFALQINSVRDISEPAYSQLLKVEGADTENTSVSATQDPRAAWERKAERMLMLELTDGTTVVEGMEYRSAPNLNVGLSPGTKVLVYGTIMMRRGILFLTQQNITVLGGKVVALLETNNQRNTLVAALNASYDDDTQTENGGGSNNITWTSVPSTHSGDSGLGGGRGGMRPQGGSLENTAPAVNLDDEELDFFDDAAFEHEFDEELIPEDPSDQNQPLEGEFYEDTALENEFDDDLDAFMSQM